MQRVVSKTLQIVAFAFLTISIMFGTAMSHDYKVGELTIDHPVARATLPNAPVSAGYMTIKNAGDEADRLVAVAVDFANRVEIHEMSMDGDVMKMRELSGGLTIPAGAEVSLKPGGYHVMFLEMKKQLQSGQEYPATLTFQRAGTIDVMLNVETLQQIREAMGGSTKEMKHHDHSGHKH